MSGNKMIDTVLVLISTVVALGLFGLFIYTEVVFEKPLPENTKELQKLLENTQKQDRVQGYEMGQMIVNLQSRTTRLRFLDVEMHFIPFAQKYVSRFEEESPIIRDIIIDTASAMTPDELNSISGKILLEDRLRRRINEHLRTKALKEILFIRFVVQ